MASATAGRKTEEFLDWFEAGADRNREAAIALERYIGGLLAEADVHAMMVTARAKTVESVRGKLLRKHYSRPKTQLMDRLGVRVILYHGNEVDPVAKLLRNRLQIHEKHSSDKRGALGLREFGYRSYHLVAALKGGGGRPSDAWLLEGQVFEVQIRSLLEHVWAEIEHDVVYKSGADWPKEIKRRFASLAGVIELLEHEFGQLTDAATGLVQNACDRLRVGVAPDQNLDVPLMCGCLEVDFPDGLSFRQSRAGAGGFPVGLEQQFWLALRRNGIKTLGGFRRALKSPRMVERVRRYAKAEGVPELEVSHLALLSLLLGLRDGPGLKLFFAEYAENHSIRLALSRRPAGKPRRK